MPLTLLDQTPSLAMHFIADLRNVHVQQDRQRFRLNLERLGELMACEIGRSLPYEPADITTPLGTAHTRLMRHDIVLGTVLRAGLPFYQGFLRMFDRADSAFVGAYRAPHEGVEDIAIRLDYVATPSLQDKILIVADPMLATGGSLLEAIQALLAKGGQPAALHIAAAIASQQGIAKVLQDLPDAHLWVGAADPDLNHLAYIVPGLGDAGDLAFGEKL